MEGKQLISAGKNFHPETDADKTEAVDTYHIANKNEGQQATVQILLDAIAERIITRLLEKTEIAEWAKQQDKPAYTAAEVGADRAGSSAAALAEAKDYADDAYRQATGYTDREIAGLINGAPNTLNTLGEIAAAMLEHQGVVEALEAAIGSKASDVEYQAHASNNVVHVNASKQEKWDGYEQQLAEVFTSVSNGKKLVASAITDKGINTEADAGFQTMADNIKKLQKPSGNATAAQVLNGYTFSNASGTGISGGMANRGAVTAALNAGGSYTIQAGYHNGTGKVTANALSGQTSATAAEGNITKGKTAWVNGKKITGTGADNTAQYNAGVAAADARANASSANYKAGYNAGVTAADARANPSSANYKAGYNAGYSTGKKGPVTVEFYSINGNGAGIYLDVSAFTKMTLDARPGAVYYLKNSPNASAANKTGSFANGVGGTLDITGYTAIGLWFDGSNYSGGTQRVTFS